MKNFYCSFLNFSKNRLIYQEHQDKNSPEAKAESSEGAKKEGSGLKVGGENIVVTDWNFEYGGFSKALEFTTTTEIRPDGTFVRLKEKPDGQSVTFDSRTEKKIYTLPEGKKAPDEF